METYKDIEDFIIEAFPVEFDKILKRKKSEIDRKIEGFDSEFDEKLKTIIKGADATEAPASPDKKSK